MRHYTIFAGLFAVCWQCFWWQSAALEVTFFEVKQIVGQLSLREQFEWGKTALRLGQFDSAANVFRKIHAKYPSSSSALAYLAIAYAEDGDCNQSIKSFESYRAQAQPGPVSYYWNGVCLEKNQQFQGARESFYSSVSLSRDATPAAEALLKLLVRMGYKHEASSLLGSISKGNPFLNDRWRKAHLEMMALSDQQPSLDSAIKSIRLPAVETDQYWVTIQIDQGANQEFVMINPNADVTLVNVRLWTRINSFTGVQRQISSEKSGNLEALEVGPWLIESLPVEVCETCETVFGKDFLSQFEYSDEKEAGVNFLTMNRL